MTVFIERAIGHGEAKVTYGSGEKPRYSALARTIQQFYQDLQPPLADLREAVFAATDLPQLDESPLTKQEQDWAREVAAEYEAAGRPAGTPFVVKAPEPFRFGAKMRRVIDRAIEIFIEKVAGPDRTREGYVNGGVESDQSDGILQQRQILAYSVGLRRASDLVGAAQTLVPSRQDPAVMEMLNNAFSRLSTGGSLRLETVRDDIHSILVSGADAGSSPLDVGRQLSRQFDQYSGYEFERLARTESAFASEAGNREQLREFGVTMVVWLLSSGACPLCQAYEGKIIDIEDIDNQPPIHPNDMCSTVPYLGGPL